MDKLKPWSEAKSRRRKRPKAVEEMKPGSRDVPAPHGPTVRIASSRAYRPFLALVLVLLTASLATAQESGRIVSIVGKAEVLRAGQWQPARLHQDLLPGDVVRPGPGSRVAILLADRSMIKVNANSTLELKQVAPPPGTSVPVAVGLLQTILSLFNGEIWVRNPGVPLEIKTPAATATIRGTELNLSIGRAVETRLAVLDGSVEFHNPQGRVLVEAGEQATASVGDAPRKTVLVNPVDAVQWSLYYPGIVSFRDYPLKDVAPDLLPQKLAEAQRRVASTPDDAEARAELGELLFDLGRRAQARSEFEKVLAIDPQSPEAHAGLGWVNLVEGNVEAALREFHDARSRTRSVLVGTANALYRLNRFEEAEQVLIEAKGRFPSSPQPRTQAALLYLIEGRVANALFEIEQALSLDSSNALAYGLLSNIYLVQNKKDMALEAAEQAVAANPSSPSAYLNLSLVKQAEFQIESALEAARKAVELDPDDPQALIQVSRLLLGMGRLSEAFDVAEQARHRAPQDPLVNSTWGFLVLAQYQIQEAAAAFDHAIEADSTLGEPHLGRGLALFRQGKTEEAVQEMWMATLLEPQVSLFHSYLGKALYEVKLDGLALDQFAIAKKLDPRDPTPWFYAAILEQSVNRPVEALHDVQKSIELNDNRAVYRSRLLLDEDLAARAVTLGRIYDELGFRQRSLVEGWKSLNVDPSNYSAHRFLSDSYSVLPRHEIARVSELLQSQLLQPINMTPVQPQLAQSKLLILDGTGPAKPSLNEFQRLFAQDRFALLASGIAGDNDTFGDEVVPYGVWEGGRISYSLGQFHYETDGFRENNDLTQDIYNAFVQVGLAYNTSVQAEFRHTETEKGDRDLRFFPDDFFPNERQDLQTKSVRLGVHHAFSPRSDFIASFIYSDADDKLKNRVPVSPPPAGPPPPGAPPPGPPPPGPPPPGPPPINPELELDIGVDKEAYTAEVQHVFWAKWLNLVSGIGHLNSKRKEVRRSEILGLPFPSLTIETSKQGISHTNFYVYSQFNYLENLSVTLGGSADFFRGAFVDRDQLNPKLGLTWNPFLGTTLRAAVFRVLKRNLISDQTIEPTQVAGFNQFFDDAEGTDAWRYGIALDQKISANMYAGAELSKRDLEVPFLKTTQTMTGPREETRKVNWDEYLARAYLYWTAHPWVAASAEYQFERFERDPEFEAGIKNVETHRLFLGINLFHPSGFSARLKTTYVDQDGSFRPQFSPPGIFVSGSDQFWVIDAAIGYRFPRRRGLFTVEVRNLFNEGFRFQDTDPANPVIQPERLIFARFTLSF